MIEIGPNLTHVLFALLMVAGVCVLAYFNCMKHRNQLVSLERRGIPLVEINDGSYPAIRDLPEEEETQ